MDKRKFPAKNGWQDALQKLREENGKLRKQIATLKEKLLDAIPGDIWIVATAKYEEQITALTAEHEDRCGAASKCIANLTAENRRLRDRLKTHGDIQTDEEEAEDG